MKKKAKLAKNGFWLGIVFFVLVLFIIRLFFLELTVVTSNSMLPTLARGDYVLVTKYIYGVVVPGMTEKFFATRRPQRGALVVFRRPFAANSFYIKRVIGLPGDHISYENNTLVINGDIVRTNAYGRLQYHGDNMEAIVAEQFTEYLGQEPYRILDNPHSMHAKNSYWLVPENHYFVLGDNRDDSQDSRFIGYIPYEDLVGEPVMLSLP